MISIKNTSMMAILAGVLALPVAASAESAQGQAQQQHPTMQQVFDAVDANSDGSVDQNEYKAFEAAQSDAGIGLAHEFKELDQSKTGTLTIAEFSKQRPVPLQR